MREEDGKSSDFAIQLIADEKSERGSKFAVVGSGGKSSGCLSVKVKNDFGSI